MEPRVRNIQFGTTMAGDEYFHRLANCLLVGIFHTDLSANCLFVNEQWCKITGLGAGEAEGKGWLHAFHPDDRDRIRQEWYAAAQRNRPFKSEYRLLHSDGDVRWVEGGATQVRSRRQILYGYLWTIIDITERKRAEAATTQLAAIIQSSDDAFIGRDIKGCITSFNPGAERILGYTQEEVLGKHHSLLIPPEGKDEFPYIMERFQKRERVNPYEAVRRKKDGTLIDVSVAVSPIYNSTGELVGSSKVLRDITWQKKVEGQLRENEERLRLALEAGSVGTWYWDILGERLFWSQYMYEIFGQDPKFFELSLQKFFELVHPDDLPHVKDKINISLETLGSYQVEMRILRPNGEVRWLACNGKVYSDPPGRAGHMLGAAIDITEQRRLQESLQKELVRRERTQAQLSRSNQELEQFAYVASHDLQEPLQVINSFVDLLVLHCKNKLEQKEKEYLKFIKIGAGQARNLIRELLDYSRIGKGDPNQIVDLNKVMEEVEFKLKIFIEESHASIKYHDLPTIRAEHIEMVQLFQNLISNAVKYRGTSAPEIIITAKKLEQGYLFSVKDNGVGIDPQYKERIFGMFERLNLKSGVTGTGIGLAICKKIVENYGGKIWVEANTDPGTTFCFTLIASTLVEREYENLIGGRQ